MVQIQKPTKPDRTIVSLASIRDMKYWVDKFGVNAAQLREAVSRVGTNPDLIAKLMHR